jgi:serine/threonine-protein kinase
VRGAIRFVIAVAILVGCGGEVAHPIPEWTLAYDGTTERVVLPQHLDVPDRAMTYTLRADFAVPPALRDRPLSLVIPFFAGLTRLRVDEFDAVDTEPEPVTGYRGRGPKSWQLPYPTRGRDRVTLEIIVEHRWKQSGWLDTIPRILPSEEHDSVLTAIKLINDYGATLALFGLTLIGLLYLAIYVVDRRRKQYKWFAIQGLSAISYPLFLSGLSQGMFGRFDIVLLAAMLPTAAIAAVVFTHETLKLGKPSRIWIVLFAINLLVAVIASNPFAAMDYAARVAVATIAIVVVYQIWVCGRLAFRPDRPVGARYLLVAWSALSIAAGPDFAVWLGFGDQIGGVRTSCLGLALFAIAQALLLGREHVLSLKQSDELNAALASRVDQLEGRQKEIELLNTELRRQIADRSEELFGALRTLAATAGSAPALAEGQLVQERYRVVRSLGTGGMGAVYEVVRISDDKRFALKVTRQHDAVALARLAREARIAAQVAHPNVVAIIDVDVASAGFLFMVIELVDGKALHERVDRYRDQDWMIPVLAQIAAGLAALHRHGIVHRDLKPANILIEDVDGMPRVKITDFGISRIAEDEPEGDVTALLKPAAHDKADSSKRTPNRASTPLTTTGFVAGTPMYMAPELTTGDSAEVLPSADVFSFGILAFQVLAGHPPWSEPPSVTAARRSVPRPRSLTEEVPTLPRPFSQLVARCLALAPEDRPTAAELADALDKLAAEKKAG